MRPRTGIAAVLAVLSAAGVIAATTTTAGASAAKPAGRGHHGVLVPGDLLVSESYYQNDPGLVAGATVLPPGAGSAGTEAVASGNYPYVFNNVVKADTSFGVTSPLYLKEMTPDGQSVATIPVPTQYLTTSSSSKSEGALNLSTAARSARTTTSAA
jgi:hypothetical protein